MPNNSQISKWLNKFIPSKHKTQSNDDLENASIAHKTYHASSRNGLCCDKRVAELETKVDALEKQVKEHKRGLADSKGRERLHKEWMLALATSGADVEKKVDDMSKDVAMISNQTVITSQQIAVIFEKLAILFNQIAMISDEIAKISDDIVKMSDEIVKMSDDKVVEGFFLDEDHGYYDQQTNMQSRAEPNWI